MEIAVKLLNNELSLQFIINLMQESQSVRIGLKSQYFVARSLFRDEDARVHHGKKSTPDIVLSDPRFIRILVENSRAEIEDTTDLEIKNFAWNYSSFSNAIKSYKKRGQEDNLFIGISPIFLYRSNETITFNKLSEGIISVVVLSMESLAEGNKEIWDKLVTLTEQQVPEGFDIKEMPLDKILEIINFRKIVEIDEFNSKQEEFNSKQDEFNSKQEEFNSKQEEFNSKQEEFNSKQDKFNSKQEKFNSKQEDFNKLVQEKLDTLIDLLKK